MKLTNAKDDAIMYSLNKDEFRELRPNEFIFVPDTCRQLHIKPSESTYTLSIDQLMNYPSGEIKQIIIDKQIKANYDSNSLVVAEGSGPIGFLNYLKTDILGVGQRLFVPSFDLTKYDLDGNPKPVIIDTDKVKKRLSDITSSNAGMWWLVIFVILLIAIIIPVMLYAYAVNL
jgi:hypothetical protein